jgi:hypothetical protein
MDLLLIMGVVLFLMGLDRINFGDDLSGNGLIILIMEHLWFSK